MSTSSKYFDRIRIGKRRSRQAAGAKAASAASAGGRTCQWDGCESPATHRAPMGRQHEGGYFHFCFDHVREYNKSYNYFSGLDDEAVARFQKDAVVGHRPTWTMGVNRWGGTPETGETERNAGASARIRARLRSGARPAAQHTRQLKSLERKALDDLGLPHTSRPDEIKARYKELVKRHHPDANGGDRSLEGRLRQIIQAYKLLKQSGLC
ncbi:MAG: J domain-containing protein [Pseudomonadota bacterium]|nr:J domain-containing protein [Pseudomonadota bacterium]